jgi:hypothetical protein
MIKESMAIAAVRQMTALRYFPTEPAAHGSIAEILMRMVGNAEQLSWLTKIMLDRVGEWPGTRELRAVFCTRFKPADGVEEWSMLPGFMATDSEVAVLEAHDNVKAIEQGQPRIGGNTLRRLN